MVRIAGRVVCQCVRCGTEFRATPRQVADGAKYCSVACYAAARTGTGRGRYALPIEKSCAACGATFLAGGRGRAPARQRFCSNECQRAARYRNGAKCNTLTVPDAAYLAGLIDGEGAIMLVLRATSIGVKVNVTNTHREVLEWIKEITAVGNVQNHRAANDAHRATYFWACNGDGALTFLREIRPYLRIKAVQADLAIETQERLRDPALKADRSWHEDYRQRMKALNARGPG